MWPFNQKTKQLIMPRYTKQAWLSLNLGTEDDWYDSNNPNDVTSFVKKNIVQYIRKKKKKLDSAIIATIDKEYIAWLGKRRHNKRNLDKYIVLHKSDTSFWIAKMINSKMTNSYNVLCIPINAIACKLDRNKTLFKLDKNCVKLIEQILAFIYHSNYIYCPGWILKGGDAPICVEDIVNLAEVYWNESINVRIGKYEEQQYNKIEIENCFIPKLFVIPFVVRVETKNPIVNLSGIYDDKDTSSHAMTYIKFGTENRMRLMEIIKNNVELVVGIGETAIMPGQACVAYQEKLNLIKNKKHST